MNRYLVIVAPKSNRTARMCYIFDNSAHGSNILAYIDSIVATMGKVKWAVCPEDAPIDTIINSFEYHLGYTPTQYFHDMPQYNFAH